MTKRYHLHTVFAMSLLLLDACALVLAFQLAYWTRFSSVAFTSVFPPLKGIPQVALYENSLWAVLPVCLMVFSYLGFYRQTMLSAYDEFVLVLRGMILCALLTTTMSFAYRAADYSRLVIALWTFYSVAFVYLLRELDKSLFRQLRESFSGPQHVLVIGQGRAAEAIRELSKRQPLMRAIFLDQPPADEAFNDAVEHRRISEVMLVQGSVSAGEILRISRLCEALDLECKVLPDLLEMRRGEIIVDGFYGLPTFRIKPLSLHGTNYLVKRAFDIAVSVTLLTLFSLPLLIIALLIRLETPGPILFSQDRVGWRGRKFKLYKFRTMVANADDYIEQLKHLSDRPGPVFKMKKDPRVTKVGRWLRATSVDEVPQIINVLKGDMSIVGPRPQVVWEASHYDDHAKKRLRVMPGITGLWQVSGRAALSYEEMIDLDIFYLENWSLGLDLKIMLRTLPAIFAQEGAY